MSWLNPFWIALQLLTRLPARNLPTDDPALLGRSLAYYPLVGLVIGALLAATGALLAPYLAPLPLAALLVAGWAALTGALHLDGLADSADGWLGGHGNRERTLEIMHDPRSGPAGVVAIALMLLLKFSALTIVLEHHGVAAVACIPALARTLAALLFLTTPCARREGMGAAVAAAMPRPFIWGAVLISVAAVALAAPHGPWLTLAGLAAFVLIRRLMLVRIGGLTGDTTGALVELSETAALLVLSALA